MKLGICDGGILGFHQEFTRPRKEYTIKLSLQKLVLILIFFIWHVSLATSKGKCVPRGTNSIFRGVNMSRMGGHVCHAGGQVYVCVESSGGPQAGTGKCVPGRAGVWESACPAGGW